MTFIWNVGVILIHFYGRRGSRSRTGSRLPSTRTIACPLWLNDQRLLKGVTETGSAPQVPGYRWIHLSFLFYKPPFPLVCHFINLFLPSCLSSFFSFFIIPRRIESSSPPQISISQILRLDSFLPRSSNCQQFIIIFITNFNIKIQSFFIIPRRIESSSPPQIFYFSNSSTRFFLISIELSTVYNYIYHEF